MRLLEQSVLKLQRGLEGLENRLLGSTPRLADSEGLGQSPRVCISSKFPGEADPGVPEPQLKGNLKAITRELVLGVRKHSLPKALATGKESF